MGYKGAALGAIIGIISGVLLMAFLLSQIGSQLNQSTRDIFTYFVPMLFGIYGAYSGYESDI